MPTSASQWAWFLFFVGGSVGGWVALCFWAYGATRFFKWKQKVRRRS